MDRTTGLGRSGIYEKYLEYIGNVDGGPLIEWFDEDWEPIGPVLRKQMKQAGLIYEKDGRVFVVPGEGEGGEG